MEFLYVLYIMKNENNVIACYCKKY